jgi:multidrug resistance protein, MATE family
MASGLETLCGQAYGAKQYDKLVLQTYRAIVTLIVVSFPISALWLFIGKLLILIGQDPSISKEAGRYIGWLIPGLFAYAVSQPLTKFLQSQSLIIPMLWSSIATLLLHIPLCWLLVFKTSLGFIGASLAISFIILAECDHACCIHPILECL